MSELIKFRTAIQNNFNELSKDGSPMFILNLDKNSVWDVYISAFPEGTNEVYRTNTEYDCVCCKQFIRLMGRVVGTKNGKRVSVMENISTGTYFDAVAEKLVELSKGVDIAAPFVHNEREIGKDHTFEKLENGELKKWDHFHQVLPLSLYMKQGFAEFKGTTQTNRAVLKRSLGDISENAITEVIELIEQKLLYRGEEHLKTVKLIQTLKKELTSCADQEIFLWKKALELKGVCSLRNTVIGTLLCDISEGVDINKAVKSFESKVAPHNYKRTTALITPKMKEEAKKKAHELGIESSFMRRYAKTSDFDVNNVLYINNTNSSPVCSDTVDLDVLDKVTSISIEDFIKDVLPTSTDVQVLFEKRHNKNLVSLITASNEDAKNIFKWNNNFSWTYNGNITDSDMRQAVMSKGGNVDGVFRFTHQWNYDKRNSSLMDLHVFLPGNGTKPENGVHENYGNRSRVGWNNRSHSESTGIQDVDYTDAAPEGYVPVENITFSDLNKMPEGTYICKIHNWTARLPNLGGFKAEIEFDGQIFQYEYDKPLSHHEWVTVAEVTLKNGKFTIKHHLEPINTSVKEVWGIETLKFHKVQMLMLSPNYWSDNSSGNKHYFFTISDCKNPDNSTGFYNEFLMEELVPHRKVFECLSGALKAPYSDEQVSGIGFSSTQRNHVFVKVQGQNNTTLKVLF